MILGIGVDIIEVPRIAAALEQYGERFERRVFAEEEIAYCRRTPSRAAERYAARFAAKEAFSKAIGTGISMGTRWRDIVVLRKPSGQPTLVLRGPIAERYGKLRAHLSLTHINALAIAYVVLESDGQSDEL